VDTILVVDDEEAVGELVRMYLEKEGFRVEVASDGRLGLDRVRAGDVRLVLLDLMLPGLDGWTVCREIRKFSNLPVIILTARGEEADRVLGLDLGADDYVVKPFSPRELTARVKAILRRRQTAAGSHTLFYPDLVIDCRANTVELSGREIRLSRKEFALLWFLASHPGRTFTRDQLLEELWGDGYDGDGRTVDTHIARLREKLRTAGGRSYLKTVWGQGYKFEASH